MTTSRRNTGATRRPPELGGGGRSFFSTASGAARRRVRSEVLGSPKVVDVSSEERQSSSDSLDVFEDRFGRHFENHSHVSGDIASLRKASKGFSFDRDRVDAFGDIAEHTCDVSLKTF